MKPTLPAVSPVRAANAGTVGLVIAGSLGPGDAAGLTLNTGLTVRGMDLAVGSAVAAAEAIGSALEQKDTSKAALAGYVHLRATTQQQGSCGPTAPRVIPGPS